MQFSFQVLSFTHRWEIEQLNTSALEGVVGAISSHVPTLSSKLAFRAGFFYHSTGQL